jgi:D-methionine transport system permease protein
MEPFISVKDLHKTFYNHDESVEVLKGVNLEVTKGDIYGIVGFSGAGKSTLIRCLNRMESPDSGTVRVGDNDITSLDKKSLNLYRQKIGMIFQHFNLFDSRTVFNNVAFPLEIAGCGRRRNMNLNNSSLLGVLKSAFSAETWAIITPAIWQTLYMTAMTTLLTFVFGIILGIVLVVTDKNGIHPMPVFNNILGGIVNMLRSLPSMILIILTLPLSRIIIGISYGPQACIIALVASCVPMFGRLVESSILEVPKGKFEAAYSMGTPNFKIVTKVLLPEALPSLVRNFTIAVIAIISTTALAGSFGAGGLGDVAVRFGYERFKTDILIAAVIVLVVLVEFIQFAGDRYSKHITKKRFLV